jgi:hypothetical protein
MLLGYMNRYKLEHPVDPTFLLNKRVSIKGSGVESWFDGVVQGYSGQDCKHTVSVQYLLTPAHRIQCICMPQFEC